MKLKIVFMGTPDFSVPILEALIENYDVISVVTQPDRISGKKILEPAIKKVALKKIILALMVNLYQKPYLTVRNMVPLTFTPPYYQN